MRVSDAGGRRRVDSPGPSRPNSISPSLKPPLTLEDWESKAPLSEHVTQSISYMKKACEQRPMPLKFVEDGEPSSRTSTPKLPTFPPSRPATPDNSKFSNTNGGHHPLHPTQPIVTPQQFYDWFAIVERTISHSQESHFRQHLETVEEHLARCDLMRERVVEVEGSIQGMLQEWRSVDEGAESLQAACERLLEERDRLLEVTDAIALRLEYYQELEQATRMLNYPGDALVLQADFLLMVERVDVCIEWFQEHRHFSEAEIYLLRFQHCMTRAMTLIKMYFVGTLKALTADIQRRMAEKDLSETAENHLLYSKFRSIGGQTAPLIAELERRASAHPEELSSLLAECQTTYFQSRKAMIAGRLMAELKTLDPARSDLVELTRSGCSYLKELCTDEFELYRMFFNSGEDKLYRYLEGLCDYLYDDLRPRILHEPQLTVLCQVCTILQALMVLDVSDLNDDDVDVGGVAPGDKLNGRPHPDRAPQPLRRLHISQLLQMILQDAQTRLFFKAQAVIQSDIRYYAPTSGDLDYPARLQGSKASLEVAERAMSPTSTGEELFASLPSKAMKTTWYPTLQKLHWILELLHDFVKPSIFADMAQEAISTCRQSILSAAQLIGSTSSDTDARLFIVRHLLVLKEIVSIVNAAESQAAAAAGGVLAYERPVDTYMNASGTLRLIIAYLKLESDLTMPPHRNSWLPAERHIVFLWCCELPRRPRNLWPRCERREL
ncbi:Sec34-domain-containing protein [Clavulina sp. PMI_390]|nr:Sec34-domain-containing protein [Clavulina sp. PMI_390]